MIKIATLADKRAVEAEMPWQDRWRARTLSNSWSRRRAVFRNGRR